MCCSFVDLWSFFCVLFSMVTVFCVAFSRKKEMQDNRLLYQWNIRRSLVSRWVIELRHWYSMLCSSEVCSSKGKGSSCNWQRKSVFDGEGMCESYETDRSSTFLNPKVKESFREANEKFLLNQIFMLNSTTKQMHIKMNIKTLILYCTLKTYE